jgi:hypothetical protein
MWGKFLYSINSRQKKIILKKGYAMMKRSIVGSVLLFLPAMVSAADQGESQENREIIKTKLLNALNHVTDPIIKDDSRTDEFAKGSYSSPCGLVYVCLVTCNVRSFNPYGDAECPWKQWDLYCHYAHYDNGVIKRGGSTKPVMSANTSNGNINMHEWDKKGFGCIRMGNTAIVSGQELYGPIFDLKQEPENKSFSFIYRPSSYRKQATRFIYYLDGRKEESEVDDVEKYLETQPKQ